MTRALRTLLGWSCVAVALSISAAACGDDDDGDDGKSDAGAGRGGSGGSGGSRAGSGGAGGSISAAMCKTAATAKAAGTTFTAACLECACGASPTVVAGCTNGCWKVLECAGTMCADKLNDAAAAGACVGMMCMAALGTDPGAPGAQNVGPFIDGPTCKAKCRGVVTDAGMDDDAGGDAGQ